MNDSAPYLEQWSFEAEITVRSLVKRPLDGLEERQQRAEITAQLLRELRAGISN